VDISGILKDWPFQHGHVAARRIVGADGREKIQLRLDLGLLQMETSGRPDGQRPYGCESLLDYHEKRLARHRRRRGGEEGFRLDEQACELLRAEAMMYYHRYLAEFVLEDFDAVERDTLRNLRLMDFCRAYAAEESDRHVLEQYRPYVLMMCARARARRALDDSRPRAALAALRRGIRELKGLYEQDGGEDLVGASTELTLLRAMARDIQSRIPASPIRKLRQELSRAVREERYEDAAALRDRINALAGRRDGQDQPAG